MSPHRTPIAAVPTGASTASAHAPVASANDSGGVGAADLRMAHTRSSPLGSGDVAPAGMSGSGYGSTGGSASGSAGAASVPTPSSRRSMQNVPRADSVASGRSGGRGAVEAEPAGTGVTPVSATVMSSGYSTSAQRAPNQHQVQVQQNGSLSAGTKASAHRQPITQATAPALRGGGSSQFQAPFNSSAVQQLSPSAAATTAATTAAASIVSPAAVSAPPMPPGAQPQPHVAASIGRRGGGGHGHGQQRGGRRAMPTAPQSYGDSMISYEDI